MSFNVGVVGATGVVGQEFLNLLVKRGFPVNELRLYASENNIGTKVDFGDREITCTTLKEGCFRGLDVVFFSSGDEISLKWAPIAVASGAFAIDNSAAFRMNPEHMLVVPEINGQYLPNHNKKKEIIANPNCSTIQLVMALAPLAIDFGISNVRVATYQSVSGAGRDGILELKNQLQALLDHDNKIIEAKAKKSALAPLVLNKQCFPHQVAYNSLPHIGSFDKNEFCSEENKIMNETRKILNMPHLPITAFTVRVPTLNGHSEAAWVSLDQDVSIERIESCLKKFKGLQYVPHSSPEAYPTVLDVDGKYDVSVGRLRKDPNDPKTILMWIVADNLLKGAALNGLQIAEQIFGVTPTE